MKELEYQYCPACGTKSLSTDRFCMSCGKRLGIHNAPQEKKEKKMLKKLVVVGIWIAMIGVAIGVFINLFSGGSIGEQELTELIKNNIPQHVLEYRLKAQNANIINFVHTIGTYTSTVNDIEILQKTEIEDGYDVRCEVLLSGEYIDRIYYYDLTCLKDKQGWYVVSYEEYQNEQVIVNSLPKNDVFFSISNYIERDFRDTSSHKDDSFSFEIEEGLVYSFLVCDRKGVGQGYVVADDMGNYSFDFSIDWAEDEDYEVQYNQIIGTYYDDDWEVQISSMDDTEVAWHIVRNKVYDDDVGGRNSGKSQWTIEGDYITFPLTLDYSFGIGMDDKEHITHYDCIVKIPIKTEDAVVYFDAIDPVGYWGGTNYRLEKYFE